MTAQAGSTHGPILVVNPNSDTGVTAALSRAVAPFRLGGGPPIEVVTIAEGPLGIVTQRDVAEAGLRVADLAAARPDASAIVIACYSQPGLDLLRAETRRPVVGMQDGGVLAALGLADRFGVIAVAEGSIPRHLAHLARMGVMGRLAGEVAPARPITVAQSGDPAASFELLREAGMRLKLRGAGAVVLGCAGMSPQRGMLEQALDIPVVDAVQAAVAQALGRVLAGIDVGRPPHPHDDPPPLRRATRRGSGGDGPRADASRRCPSEARAPARPSARRPTAPTSGAI